MANYPVVDQCVLEAAQRGEEAAFAEIYRVFRKYLCAVTRKNLRKALYARFRTREKGSVREPAEEIVQEAFLAAFQHFDRFDVSKPLAPWLVAIALNRCRNYARGRVLRTTRTLDAKDSGGRYDYDSNADLADGRVYCNPERWLLNTERGDRIAMALEKLSERRRAVVVMRFVDGLSRDEICARLDLPLTTVVNEVNRGRWQMRELLRSI